MKEHNIKFHHIGSTQDMGPWLKLSPVQCSRLCKGLKTEATQSNSELQFVAVLSQEGMRDRAMNGFLEDKYW